MKPLQTVYWLRFGLGVVAALICTVFGVATGTITNDSGKMSYTWFLNGLVIALALYLLSYYVIKPKFILSVQKPPKLVTTGIGIYFLAWIVFWVLLYTVIAGQLVV